MNSINGRGRKLKGREMEVSEILKNEWLDLRGRISASYWVEESKRQRMIDKWIRVDAECAMRDVKVPFDA
jgi:hypothetical protein